MFKIDAISAKHGDCLIIHYGDPDRPRRVLVDGGPGGVYRRHLRPRLKELRAEDGRDRPVEFELAMISHVDDDHIRGLLDLTKEMIREEDSSRDPARILRFWHNSFDDLTGGGTQPAALTAAVDAITASAGAGGRVPFEALEKSDGRAEHILASINQGRQLRDNLVVLGLDENRPFGDKLVFAGKDATLPGGMHLDIVGPDKDRLTDLRDKWNPNLSATEIASISDASVANLSSIVTLVTFEGKRILLTGDARGDDIVDWLAVAGHIGDGGTCHVDVLKMPHHGSDRNVDDAFFRTITADTYLYCANGHHDNPDIETFRMMRAARPGGGYRVVMSNEIEMQHPENQPGFDAELAALRDAGIPVEIRDADSHHITITLI